MAGVRRPWLQQLLIFAGILAAAILIHVPALRHARPFCCDNLAILEWAHHASPADIAAGDRDFPLEWRPLPHLLIWLEYRLWGITSLTPYLLVNLCIWAGAVWLFVRLAYAKSGSALAAAVGAAFLLSARRTGTLTEFLMGMQTGLACLFGFAALNIALTGLPSRARTVAVFVLLLLAGFGKEYGLAFAAGLVVWGWLRHRRDLAQAGIGALALYLILRISAGAAGPLCDQQAFFSGHRMVCFDRFELTTVTQVAYNMGAGLVHTIYPGFFVSNGLIGWSPLRLLQSAFWLPFVVAGARRGPLPILALLILAANAMLQAPLFRSRNTTVGIAMLALVIALGVPQIEAWCRARGRRRAFTLLCAGIALALAARVTVAFGNISRAARSSAIQDPCITLHQGVPIGADYIRLIKTAYALEDPDCTQTVSERQLEE